MSKGYSLIPAQKRSVKKTKKKDRKAARQGRKIVARFDNRDSDPLLTKKKSKDNAKTWTARVISTLARHRTTQQ